MHIRLLIALPSLVAAELIVHSLLRFVVHCFVKRHIVSPDDLPGFDSAIESSTWYAMPGGRWHLTPAGFWYVFVSIPIFQFFLLLWYMR